MKLVSGKLKNFLCRFREGCCLLDGRVGRRIHDAEDDALIFSWRELATHEKESSRMNIKIESPKRDPDRVNRRPICKVRSSLRP